MTLVTDRESTALSFTVQEVSAAEAAQVRAGYALLQKSMDAGDVEDFDSFLETVSTTADAALAPKLVCASHGEEIVGFTVGAYLPNLNMGFVSYAAVEKGWRRRGVYTAMRELLVALLNREARPGGAGARHQVDYIISEQAEGSRLYRRYIHEWGAFVLPCAYEQPAVQGLAAKGLKLVLQPMGRDGAPEENEVVDIVREIYERVYRMPNVLEDPAFRRVVASISAAMPGVRETS